MSARIAKAAAWGILLKCDRTKLAEFGGHVELNRQWAHSLLKRMKFVQRKATTTKSKANEANFAEQKKMFLYDVVATVTMEEIPAKLILNTGTRLELKSCPPQRGQCKSMVQSVLRWLGLMINARSRLFSADL